MLTPLFIPFFQTDKAKRSHGTSPDTPCSFYSNHDRSQNGFATTSGPAIDVADDVSATMLRETAASGTLELSPWVNQVSAFLNHSNTYILISLYKRHLSPCSLNFLSKLLCSYSSVWGTFLTIEHRAIADLPTLQSSSDLCRGSRSARRSRHRQRCTPLHCKRASRQCTLGQASWP